jgi:DNA adenine methylase
MNTKPVNVASVPQRSPFRYPGGKTWLVPHVRRWLTYSKPSIVVEPFTGGGIVGLTAAFEKLVDRVVLIERDENVAAVWKTILGRNAKWLVEQIEDFEISRDNVCAALAEKPTSIRQHAFYTILRNRTSHGGIMAHGSGMVKNGESGKGISSRWYPATLAQRILAIHEIRDRIEFIEGDALEFISDYFEDSNTAFFVDPPYTASTKKAGTRLYQYNELDHDRLFDLMESAAGDFLMTYDDDPKVREMAQERDFNCALVPMKNTHHASMMELLIGRDVSWADVKDPQLRLFP